MANAANQPLCVESIEHFRRCRVDEAARRPHTGVNLWGRRTLEFPERGEDGAFEFAARKRDRPLRHAAMLRRASEYVNLSLDGISLDGITSDDGRHTLGKRRLLLASPLSIKTAPVDRH